MVLVDSWVCKILMNVSSEYPGKANFLRNVVIDETFPPSSAMMLVSTAL